MLNTKSVIKCVLLTTFFLFKRCLNDIRLFIYKAMSSHNGANGIEFVILLSTIKEFKMCERIIFNVWQEVHLWSLRWEKQMIPVIKPVSSKTIVKQVQKFHWVEKTGIGLKKFEVVYCTRQMIRASEICW